MSAVPRRRLIPLSIKHVRVEDKFWAPRQEANRCVTLPHQYEQCRKTGRINALRVKWKPGDPDEPHRFWDSDIAKWIEAAACSLATCPDRRLRKQVEGLIALLEQAQQKDGYLNSRYARVPPKARWSHLVNGHELYCAGHLMEAAVAWYNATGDPKLLDVMCRYADHIDSVFGTERGKRRGYPGHEEIELALVKLHRVTGEERYLKLAEYFINERGRQPHYFDLERKRRGDDPGAWEDGRYINLQAHLPVRRQTAAVGHAVRAMYLYCGMADVAVETGDPTLLQACRRLWESATERRMYVTGGIGSVSGTESFTSDYDLPNETAYAETCAAIGLVLWAHRMLQVDPDGRYADVMERALYNGVLSGVSLKGDRFFYVNRLSVVPKAFPEGGNHAAPARQPWFGCACCPPNIARMISSLGTYIYAQGRGELWVHLYVGGRAEFDLGGRKVILKQETNYPWREKVRISVEPEKPGTFTLALRIPGWCRGAKLKVNGTCVELGSIVRKGYAKIKREWAKGDRVELTLPMPVERVSAHPKVRANVGRVALQRGPVVYCLEEVDNGPDLDQIVLPAGAAIRATYKKAMGGMVVLTARAKRLDDAEWEGALYQPRRASYRPARIAAVPYCLWNNRKDGEMLVWIRETE